MIHRYAAGGMSSVWTGQATAARLAMASNLVPEKRAATPASHASRPARSKGPAVRASPCAGTNAARPTARSVWQMRSVATRQMSAGPSAAARLTRWHHPNLSLSPTAHALTVSMRFAARLAKGPLVASAAGRVRWLSTASAARRDEWRAMGNVVSEPVSTERVSIPSPLRNARRWVSKGPVQTSIHPGVALSATRTDAVFQPPGEARRASKVSGILIRA